jgi:hypothetical protein
LGIARSRFTSRKKKSYAPIVKNKKERSNTGLKNMPPKKKPSKKGGFLPLLFLPQLLGMAGLAGSQGSGLTGGKKRGSGLTGGKKRL